LQVWESGRPNCDIDDRAAHGSALPLAGFLVGLLSLFAVGPVRTMNSGKLRYLRPNLTRRMGRQTVADGSGQSMH